MATQKIPPTSVSQAVRRNSIAFLIMLILIVVTISAVYLFLSNPVADFLAACFMAGLIVLIIGTGIRSWWWRRHCGVVLLNLGQVESSSLPAIAFGLAIGVLSLLQFLTKEPVKVYDLARAVFGFSLAAAGHFVYRQPTLITINGFYKPDTQVWWNDIAAYEWNMPQQEFVTLVLQFKRRKFLNYAAQFRIPIVQQATVEEFLNQYITRQATVDD